MLFTLLVVVFFTVLLVVLFDIVLAVVFVVLLVVELLARVLLVVLVIAICVVNTSTVQAVLGKYLGKKSDALGSSYGLVGNGTDWFVVYVLTTSDSAGVKTKLAAKASAADLYGVKAAAAAAPAITDFIGDGVTLAYYANTSGDDAETCVALKVR